jgi:PKD repeat protein
MKKGVTGLFVLALIILSNFATAAFDLGNPSYSIDKHYSPLSNVKGWINISFDGEQTNSTFSDSFNNNISVIKLLENQTYDYACTTSDCSSDYSASNGDETKSFSLNAWKSKIIGLKLDKKITSITSINFKINSNAGESCISQLKVDFLNDGTNEFANTKLTSGNCSFIKNYGCFNSSETAQRYVIGRFPNKYCQRVTLPESPGIKLGAWIKNNNDSRSIKIALYDLSGESVEKASCTLPIIEEGETSCDVNYPVIDSKDYYVCVYSETQGASEIKGYESQNGCGFYGTDVKNENAAYQIFAEGKKFDSVGTITANNSLANGGTLGGEAEDYLFERYGNLDCSGGCIIPVRFIAQRDQQITINDLQIKYETDSGVTTETRFYDVTEIPSRITSEFQKLFLDNGNFLLPASYGNLTFRLKLDNIDLFSENITIEKAPEINYLTPTKTASAYPTKFRVDVKSFGEITNYDWDFGDGDSMTTNENQVTHTYNKTGKYNMKVTVTDNSQRSSYKIFEISIESPKELINKTISKMQTDLSNVNKQLSEYDEFEQKSLKDIFDLDTMNDKLKQAQRDYKSATSEDDYNKIMTALLEINIPESLFISKAGNDLTFYPRKEDINPEVLSNIGGGNYNPAEVNNYADAVILWQQESITCKMKFTEFSAKYADYIEPVVRIFDIDVKKKNPGIDDAYIILKKIGNLTFKENYLEQEESGHVYTELSKDEANIVFSTTEDVDFTNLPLFISPRIDSLPVIEIQEEKETPTKWGLFIAIIILLLIVGLAVYIVLQEWYRRRYENYLFKNRNDLYNLVTYIQASREKKIDDYKIASKLRKAGWGREQVTYAMKRYTGKRTGMLEIPIRKLFDFFKKKNTQEKENKI